MTSFPPLTPDGVDHVLLVVEGMDDAVAFYCGVVGCRVVNSLPQYAMAELTAGLVLVDVSIPQGAWAKPEISGGRNVDHIALSMGQGEEAVVRAHLASSGVAIHEEQMEGGRLSLYIRDPWANMIELRLPAVQ